MVMIEDIFLKKNVNSSFINKENETEITNYIDSGYFLVASLKTLMKNRLMEWGFFV